MRRSLLLLLLVAAPLSAQWTAIGDMPQPAREGNALRFANSRASAVVTALSPDIVRVRITPAQKQIRDHSYAVINRDLGDPHAAITTVSGRSTISTSDVDVSIQHAPFRIAFATAAGQALDEDDAQRGTAISDTAF